MFADLRPLRLGTRPCGGWCCGWVCGWGRATRVVASGCSVDPLAFPALGFVGAVVVAAEQGGVGEVGVSAVGPRNDVVGLGPLWGCVAAGEGTPAIAGGEDAAVFGGGVAFGSAVGGVAPPFPGAARVCRARPGRGAAAFAARSADWVWANSDQHRLHRLTVVSLRRGGDAVGGGGDGPGVRDRDLPVRLGRGDHGVPRWHGPGGDLDSRTQLLRRPDPPGRLTGGPATPAPTRPRCCGPPTSAYTPEEARAATTTGSNAGSRRACTSTSRASSIRPTRVGRYPAGPGGRHGAVRPATGYLVEHGQGVGPAFASPDHGLGIWASATQRRRRGAQKPPTNARQKRNPKQTRSRCALDF